MLGDITYLFDRIRITLGDSECQLSKRCKYYDAESDVCASYRGRTEIGGERVRCYISSKARIKAQRGGLVSRIAKRVFSGLGGFEPEELD